MVFECLWLCFVKVKVKLKVNIFNFILNKKLSFKQSMLFERILEIISILT